MRLIFEKLIFFTIAFVFVASNDSSNNVKKDLAMERNDQKPQDTISSTNVLKPIRITYNLTNFDHGNISPEDQTDFDSIVKSLVNFMNKFIKVLPSQGPNKVNQQTCDDLQAPLTHQDDIINNSDLHIYIKHKYDLSTKADPTIRSAEAGPCSKIRQSIPTLGIIVFRTDVVTNLRQDNNFQNIARLLFHEFIHILGFNDQLRDYGEKLNQSIFESDQKNGSHYLLKSPKVLAAAKKFFACDTLIGLPITSSFSHWLHEDLKFEMMYPTVQYASLSIFTAMYFKDFNPEMDANENLVESYSKGIRKGCNTQNPEDKKEIQIQNICPNNCSYHGICISQSCICNPGYSGIDCWKPCGITEYSLDGQCFPKCPQGKFANPDNTCKSDCPSGYYKNEDDQTCSLCDFSCSECYGPLKTDCKACQYLTHLVSKSRTCVYCESDQYFDQEEQTCKNCPHNCSRCDSATNCIFCKDKYTISKINNECVAKKIFGCLEYNSQNQSECVSCDTGYFLKSNSCYFCRKGCLSCTSANYCLQCDESEGYTMVQQNIFSVCRMVNLCLYPCISCIMPVLQRPYCELCNKPYVLQNRKCQKSCDDGFYEDSSVCKKCDSSCKKCSQTDKNCTEKNI